jgi:hypothetical protein
MQVTKPHYLTPFPMNKYIHDALKNNLRCIVRDLTRPQEKAVHEIVRGLFTAGEPILRHLAQDEQKSFKKQGEKYSYHLGNISLETKVEDLGMRKVRKTVSQKTIIAYDMTDIAKGSARKLEKLDRIHDGSTGNITNGFMLHGVGINNVLVRLQMHDSEEHTTNQIRKKTVEEISKQVGRRGIWAFDRGNDDKKFYHELRRILKVQFICRAKENRHVVVKETGEYLPIRNVPNGKHQIYFLDKHNNQAELEDEYTLVVSKRKEDNEPIRLIANLPADEYSENDFVDMYLERWGVENLFKRVKEKFSLEKIRVLSYKKFVNLVALVQLVVIVSTVTFFRIQRNTTTRIIGVLTTYKLFIKKRTLSFCIDSFITYMKSSLEPLIIRVERPPNRQLSLLSSRQLGKLGSF